MTATARQNKPSLKGGDVGRKRQRPDIKQDTVRHKFAHRLHDLAGGRTYAQIAEVCGTSTETVSKWFAGENLPDLDYWPKLAKALGLKDYRELLPPKA